MRLLLLACLVVVSLVQSYPVPRHVRIHGQRFVLAATNETLVMSGPNIVVKGPPYLPSVSGDTSCSADNINAACRAKGTCSSCTTFNEADVKHIKSSGYNSIRLGVVWAGAQPRDEDALDPTFLKRLHALLNLTDAAGVHVVLDNHMDMVGSANCGNGAPMWLSKKAAPDLIGKPLFTSFPFSLVHQLDVTKMSSNICGNNATRWSAHSGDPNYNLLNECCVAINGGNVGPVGFNALAQRTMEYIFAGGPGRADFVRYWRLMAEAVVSHPSAFAAELMNEPMYIRRGYMYETWRAVAEAINVVVPDMSVSLEDTGEEPLIPDWLVKYVGEGIDISQDTLQWITSASTLFYAFHGYGGIAAQTLLTSVQHISMLWNVPTFNTEFSSCEQWNLFRHANISHTYWHYSSYCTTGVYFGNLSVPDQSFGACILGWAGGDPTKYTDKSCAHPRKDFVTSNLIV